VIIATIIIIFLICKIAIYLAFLALDISKSIRFFMLFVLVETASWAVLNNVLNLHATTIGGKGSNAGRGGI
jgi:hypothetical protein